MTLPPDLTGAAHACPGTSFRAATVLWNGHPLVVVWAGESPVLHVALQGVSPSVLPAVRLSATTLCVGDELGRALVIDLANGALLRDVRVG
jgi:hypothetical protein